MAKGNETCEAIKRAIELTLELDTNLRSYGDARIIKRRKSQQSPR
jgi:hypothetical protein